MHSEVKFKKKEPTNQFMQFRELENGDFFIYEDFMYIKYSDSTCNGNSIKIDDGATSTFFNSSLVLPINVEINYTIM